MRRRRRPLAVPEPHLLGHLRSTVWGPAEFVGLPPWWLTAEGLLAGTAAVGGILAATLAGTWYGIPGLADGEGGLVCAAALVVYLCVVRAGRALVGIAAVLGVCLALQAPQAAVGLVLAERGRVESTVVISVEGGPGAVSGRGLYLCSVADRNGVPLKRQIRRGCEQATRPGDALTVVYDTQGRIPPRGVGSGLPWREPLRALGGWAAALIAVVAFAVVRSFRLSPAVEEPPAS
ncbi:hypothetical protein [Streptomyces sp. CC219B]|uniref:hypothetical protein n=1 Tax=Streptomyces sp. CC219B TaxID=3044574 RepID=UPI0024A846E0|nr:hypothetical protein [Streptomyces sp. CC219B]